MSVSVILSYNVGMDGAYEDFIEVKPNKRLRVLPFYKRINPYYPIYLRQEVLERLTRVSEKLPTGLNLQIDSGYRTIETQKALWENRHKQIPGLVRNPAEDYLPHLTGGAVDVSLVDPNNREINLSQPFKKFYDEPQLYSDRITETTQDLRLTLNKLMLDEGFVPDDKEYWHFSYGDEAWSGFYKKPALYDRCESLNLAATPGHKKLFLWPIRKLWKLYNRFLKTETNY